MTGPDGLSSLRRRADDAFRRLFGRPPTAFGSAPGRVNLLGEHTDYNDGFVLPVAVDRWAVVAADRASGAVSTLHALDLGEVRHADLTRPQAPAGGFGDYLVGVAAMLAGRLDVPNVEAVVTSSVPPGGGLASSAALEVAFGRVLLALGRAVMDPRRLALLCRQAEHAFPGTPCGPMDQLAATHGRAGHALLIDCRETSVRSVPLGPVALLVVDSGVRHRLADGAYAERRRRCREAAAAVGAAALRDVRREQLPDLPPPLRAAARHVLDENERTLLAAAALRVGDLDTFGALLFDGHASLRDLFEVSCPELDAIVERAARGRDLGVIGARMTGAGFGGCVVVACRPDGVAGVEASFADCPGVLRVRSVDAHHDD